MNFAPPLNTAVLRFGAGGHPKAAAASVRLHGHDPREEAAALMADLVDTICNKQVLDHSQYKKNNLKLHSKSFRFNVRITHGGFN